MKRDAFRQWMGGLGVVAALLLALVPGIGRMAQAAGVPALHAEHAHHVPGGVPGDAAHAGSNPRSTKAGDPPAPSDRRPAIGDPDCDYCPLLASMAMAPDEVVVAAYPPVAARLAATFASPRIRWRHPWGLGSRGPP